MRFKRTIHELEKDLQRIDEKYFKLSKKQKKLAAMAPPLDKITGADFKALRDKKKQKNENLEEVELDEHREEKHESKLTRGYKANRSKSSQNKLSDLTKRYRAAKKTPDKSDDKSAIAARNKFEKGQVNTGKPSKHNYAEGLDLKMMLSESDQRMLVSELIDAMADDLLEKKKVSERVHNALKKKAKDRNAPLSALKAIYRKGMGAFYSSGSRSGQNPHSWAMGRVNSVLRGGKARSVDKSQWDQIQKHRKKKRNKK
tara:strand:+ start:330 stop:1100 length:771 start_codon:yes stop_codon:yes gene_type:complete